MNTTASVIAQLKAIADPAKIEFKSKKYGIQTSNSLGIYQADLNDIAKRIGRNSDLGIELWDTGIYEARIVTSKIFNPKDLTLNLAETWVAEFDNWEICDSFSMGVFAKSPLARELIRIWHDRTDEFEKRAAFATMAGYGLADKKAGNEVFEAFFPVIVKASTDERNFIKKAVNWALRTIGKRNKDLNKMAIAVSNDLLKTDSKSAHWIAKDAIRELEKSTVTMQDHPRVIYRPKT